jgi:hypothetical protein
MLRFLSGCQTEALGEHYDPRVNPGVSALGVKCLDFADPHGPRPVATFKRDHHELVVALDRQHHIMLTRLPCHPVGKELG